MISWITEGDPNDWGLFLWKFPGLETFTFREVNLTGLLVELLTLRSPLFPRSMPETFFRNREIFVTPDSIDWTYEQ